MYFSDMDCCVLLQDNPEFLAKGNGLKELFDGEFKSVFNISDNWWRVNGVLFSNSVTFWDRLRNDDVMSPVVYVFLTDASAAVTVFQNNNQ